MVNHDISDEVVVTVIATGFDSELTLLQTVPEGIRAAQTNGVVTRPLVEKALASVRKVSPRRNIQETLPLLDGEWEVPTFMRK